MAENAKSTAQEQELVNIIRTELACGFRSLDGVIQSARDYCEDEDAAVLMPTVEHLVPKLLQEKLAEERTWPRTTDCDRLDAAVAALNASGIAARQDFTCCGTCGSAEIGAEMDAERAHGIEPRGYTFYHHQSTEAAVDGGGVMLHYGAVEAGATAALAIAREIVDVLTRHGLHPNWNGSINTCIGVPLDWKRRLVI